MFSPLLLLAITLLVTVATNLHPYTLVNTEIACISVEDCLNHYNRSWCESAGVSCIHRYCKLIPDYPCKKATERCLEVEQRCEPIACKVDSDCDNDIYCDGTEVCDIVAGRCVTDPERPNCLYTGGHCDETKRLCAQPKVRLAWRSKEEVAKRGSLLTTTALLPPETVGTNTSLITQMQVNMTALITVAAFLFVMLFIILAYILSRSIRSNRVKKQYT